MKRTIVLGTVVTTALVFVLPFVGGSGPSFLTPAYAGESVAAPPAATSIAATTPAAEKVPIVAEAAAASEASTTTAADTEHLAQKPVPKPLPPVTPAGKASGTQARQAALAAQGLSCPANVGGSPGSAPSTVSAGGVAGTSSDDLATFAASFNSIRVGNCLQPVPLANFRYDACMEQRLFWIAEDPSDDPASAWGHIGSQRSDGLASVGCDGNLAGGMNNTAATAALKWWNSPDHRTSLYKPNQTGSTAGMCVYFAMTHGGVPDEPVAFTRSSARSGGC